VVVTLELQVQLDVYRAVAATGRMPFASDVAHGFGIPVERLREAYAAIAARRLLVLEPDGLTIRMAPPFSGVPTQHRVLSRGVTYFANCAWDALAIPAALHRAGEVRSRCEQSGETLVLPVGVDGPPPSDWLFHCEVPAARWWQDIVYT
jgi:hypothetical protein